ncbi:polyketide synthase dehydratase domain-containing protein, partial [Mycobacterium simulans]|uniref:polyketide synthase dehydratase domain-containing protein n=1 Tax=Mycobacterium simulans TaxID=627089 RepID=UPI00174CCEF5
AAVGRLHICGHSPSWRQLYPRGRVVGLPTYPFEHHRYWLAPAAAADVSAAGLAQVEHPLLGAVAELADQDQVVVTGRLAMASQGWLAGHVVGERLVFPATGFVEVVLAAGEVVGCPVIEELVLRSPLVLVEDAPTDVQITVRSGDEGGRRSFSVHARVGDRAGGQGWVLHASGVVGVDRDLVPGGPVGSVGVQPIDVDGFYERLADRGYRYSGLFRSLRGVSQDRLDAGVVAAWVELPAGTEVAGFGVHPALLDAALHALVGMWSEADGEGAVRPRVPFVVSGVRVYASGATRLQVVLTQTGPDTVGLVGVDAAGEPVISIDSLTLRELPEDIAAPSAASVGGEGLFDLNWLPVPEGASVSAAVGVVPVWAVVGEDPGGVPVSLRGGPSCAGLAGLVAPYPDVVFWVLALPDDRDGVVGDPVGLLHEVSGRVLAGLQRWLADPQSVDSQLVVVTRHAVATSVFDRSPDVVGAAVWALLHSAQNEHPGRITVVDTDASAASEQALLEVVSARPAGEAQLALRKGVAYRPRLVKAQALTPPVGGAWKLDTAAKGSLDN